MKYQFNAHTPSKGTNDWHELKAHLGKVSKLAEKFADKFDAGELGKYAGLWHDLGKYNPDFQTYLDDCHTASLNNQKPPTKKVPHAIHGAILAEQFCSDIAAVIDGHHRGLRDATDEYDDAKLERAKIELVSILASAQSEGIETDPDLDFDELLDRLPDPDDHPYAREVFDRLLFSCLIDADRLDSERFGNPETFNLRHDKPTIEQLWQIFNFKQKEFVDKKQQELTAKNKIVFDVRQEVYQHCVETALSKPGIFRLTVPTGGGKTLSSLAFGLQHILANPIDNLDRRVIMAVPYTSIIEQTVKDYRRVFAELGEIAVLEHHSAIQHDPKSKDESSEAEEGAIDFQHQARLATQNWDASLIVTTTVQLFESLFSNRTSKCRKLHNIVGSVIILDEVQTLPIALRESICSMLEELVERYHVSVVLCTATQPVLEGEDGYFKGFKTGSITDIIPVAKSREHFAKLKRVDYNLSAIKTNTKWSWQELTDRLNSHSSALVVLNTRKDALKVINSLNSSPIEYFEAVGTESRVKLAVKNSQVLHLSTLLCGAHRQLVLAEVRSRLKNKQDCILVSTQVVEAGVDLDFPAVYRVLGPLDRIVQAAGRCNREGTMDELGQVFVFELEEGSMPPKGSEYAKATGKTQQILQQAQSEDLYQPQIFTSYGNALYKLESSDKYEIQDDRENCLFETVASKFKLIDDDTYPVVVSFNDEVEKLLRQIKRRGLFTSDYQKLQPYTISIRHFEFRKHHKTSIEQPIAGVEFYIWTGTYDPIKGLPILGDPSDGILLPVKDLCDL
ncbi:CRISPR-associated helicase Cas3' [Chamaesiphon sp. OTE_75_metabat_556]|uniref:CRISPR-associated helicase Cas3' n=1 Tax=Chamaesiphon sp. OTE_75_metabat_556 TaxID=2964692 RepID=UPI00286A5103|nr:CRISPR-associated helicase Cas3' [Chamaesiphon sp. OTE_75_metabat_556]